MVKFTNNSNQPIQKQETADDIMAGLQSKFQNLKAKVNQNVDRRTSSIHKLELFCNPVKN